MTKTTAAQQRLLNSAVLVAAIRVLFERMYEIFPSYTLRDVVTIHNGQGLAATERHEPGPYGVYASGGLVGHHSSALSTKPFVVIGRKGSAGKATYAPQGGWVSDTAYYAQANDELQLDSKFLYYALLSLDFNEDIIATAIPGINRTAIYRHCIPLPPRDIQQAIALFLDSAASHTHELTTLPNVFADQWRIAARVEELAGKINVAWGLRRQAEADMRKLLLTAYYRATENAPLMPMAHVAPLVRRPVQVVDDGLYDELGIRSFGKGTFHKPAVSDTDLGTKRLFRIEPGDLLFNIVFAWEGAVAVARTEDEGRVGSHRFLTCVPMEGVSARFLCFHFLTEQGLAALGEASPGGAGRNRTLRLKPLGNIRVPVPARDKQQWFESLLTQTDTLKRLQEESAAELDALLPSVLDRAFSGGL